MTYRAHGRCLGRKLAEVVTIRRTDWGDYRVAPRHAWLIADRADHGFDFDMAAVRERAEAIAAYSCAHSDARRDAIFMFEHLDQFGPNWPEEVEEENIAILDELADCDEMERINEALGGRLHDEPR